MYARLALDGIKKNGKLYIPYIMTCVLMVLMLYIVGFLSDSPVVSAMEGGRNTQQFLAMGGFVIICFAVIFLFYTNSFLIRRRMKEFSLYNVLGMNKRSISLILLMETLYLYGLSLLLGIGLGIAFSKLAELFLVKMLKGAASYSFSVAPRVIVMEIEVFAVIFGLIYLNTLRKIRFSNPIELLRSENVGEQAPKANWFLGFLGVVILGAAYYISVTIQQPLSALILFVVAVIMVIVATYLLFIAGSVVLCRILQKNKNYYYKLQHFVSVSSMSYRMKRNGAGLASICVLLTMVLVMISSAGCLFLGAEDCINERFPMSVTAFASVSGVKDAEGNSNTRLETEFTEAIESLLREQEVEQTETLSYGEYCISGAYDKGNVLTEVESAVSISYESVVNVHFLSLADYNRIYTQSETLEAGEALVFWNKISDHVAELSMDGVSFRLREIPAKVPFRMDGSTQSSVVGSIFLIVEDLGEIEALYDGIKDLAGEDSILYRYFYYGSPKLDAEGKSRLSGEIAGLLREKLQGVPHANSYCYAETDQRADYYGTFGGLFFIGIILSVVFMTAAVLIIYYKQISEGYEDQGRFEIMQKVGMTKQDIRRSINSQMLTVFALPIGFACLHMAFAFPVINKLLMLFGFFNLPLQIGTTLFGALLCTLFYVVTYRVTSNAYFQIVSGAKSQS